MAPKRARRAPTVPVNLNVSFGPGNGHKRDRFIALKKRDLLVTKFPYLETLEKFKMINGVTTLLENGGLVGMLQKSAPTWKRPTLEFLASLERLEVDGEPGITFQLMGEQHKMSYSQVAAALGWSVGGINWNPPNDMTMSVFWQDLTGRQYKGKGGNKINSILHPCFRYVLRLLNTTIFCGGEPGQVQKDEVKHFWALSPEGVGRPPWVEYFVTKCLKEQDDPSGNITFGGLITLIAEAIPVQITADCGAVQSSAGHSFDDFTLKRGLFLDFEPGSNTDFVYRVRASQNVRLPPEPEHRFDIPDGISTFELRQQFWIGGAIPEPNVVEGANEEEGRENEAFDEEADGGDEAGGSGSGSGVDPWRQHIEQEMGFIRDDMRTMRGEMDMRYNTLESQFSRMFSYQEAMMDYFNQIGGGQFHDPRQTAREEAARQEELRRQQRHYDQGGPSGY